MAEITFDESLRQIRQLAQQAREAKQAGDVAEGIRICRQLLAHPCAHHQVAADEIWDDIHQLHRRAGEWDAAIEAKQTAIELGCRSEPDPEADIAQCHLEAGRRAEADRIFAQLRARTPDDVWLYHAAGFAYARAGDDREAERWLRDGIAVAFRTGDPDLTVMQLVDLLDGSSRALGGEPDTELHRQVDAFCEAWEPSPKVRSWADIDDIDEERPCAYCGFDPTRSHDDVDERARRTRERVLSVEAPETLARLQALPSHRPARPRLRPETGLAIAWFPAGEWEIAVARWPDLLDDLPCEHLAYSHQIEARMKRIARSIPGQTFHVAPLTVDALIAHAAREGRDAGTAEGRASCAAELFRTGVGLAWPPGRNELCWCGSDRKYKQCCGPVPAAEDPVSPG
ncbi:MAG: SEC-C metal-binding domain-containing protein [Acidimicrobiia bacterium]